MRTASPILIAIALTSSPAAAHGGGLNAEGCHNDRRNGGYHCHRAGDDRAARPLNAAGRLGGRRPALAGGVHYRNCAAARAAGAAPVRAGQPGYASHLDRDDDGVGCE